MIACTRCGRENHDHYKFCLGCGQEIAREQARAPSGGTTPMASAGGEPVPAAMRPAPSAAMQMPRTSAGVPPVPTPAAAAGVAAPRPAGTPCPSCGTIVPDGFAFCGKCGARAAPAAEAPGVSPRRDGAGAPAAAVAPDAATRGRLILIRPDGSEGGAHPLAAGANVIGRGAGMLFDGDAYLSPRHASLTLDDMGAMVEDLGSLNGVYLKITQEEEVQSGDVFRVGQELMRFDAITDPEPLEDGTEIAGSPNPGYWGRLSVVVSPSVDGASYPLLAHDVIMGRERGDILFADDGYVSGTHARISLRGGHHYLCDLGSSNGTFLRLRGTRRVARGRYLLMGQQLFKLEHG